MILSRLDRHLINNLVGTSGYFLSFRHKGVHLSLTAHRPFEGHGSVFADNFDVMRVRGETLVIHNGFADLACEVPIRGVTLLLVGCGLSGVTIALVHAGVVLAILTWRRLAPGRYGDGAAKGQC